MAQYTRDSDAMNLAAFHLERAYDHQEAGDFEDALRECDIVLGIIPSDPDAHNLRGIALEELGRDAEAVKAYGQAIELDPEFDEATGNLLDLRVRLGRE